MAHDESPTPVEAAVPAATLRNSTQATRLPLQRPPHGFSLVKQRDPESVRGFTLVELLVSMGVLVLLVFLATQLLNSAATLTILGQKQMDADSQARQLLDRMTVDFAQMVKRSDVDYYVKSSWFATGLPPGPTGVRTLLQPGNDQIAFYSAVPGYYPTLAAPTPTATPNSPVSLVAYRVNSDSTSSAYNKMERMGKGLVWNGVSTTDIPVVFIPIPVASPLSFGDVPMSPTPTPTPTAVGNPAWPQAGNMTTDASYELVGPQVFRSEYYYMLKTNGSFTDTPWDTSTGLGHYSVNGMRDVAAIIVDIAVIDPKSRVLVSDCQLAQLNGGPLPAGCTTPPQYPVLIDWGQTGAGYPGQTDWQTTPGLLAAQWRSALDANISPNGLDLPAQVISGIRVYERCFYLNK
ncbi:MAG: PulJ/GspJ family protein [Candidatus Udaeobacter sp.]